MTTAQRAQLAADWLNAGERWRVKDVMADWIGFRGIGRWTKELVVPDGYVGVIDFATNAQILKLARSEGWQENETQPAPQTGTETGQQGEGGLATTVPNLNHQQSKYHDHL